MAVKIRKKQTVIWAHFKIAFFLFAPPEYPGGNCGANAHIAGQLPVAPQFFL